jgi:hypothetical protein
LKPGYKFRPIIRDDALTNVRAKSLTPLAPEIVPDAASGVRLDPSDSKDRDPTVRHPNAAVQIYGISQRNT